jgi:hypothetical protein
MKREAGTNAYVCELVSGFVAVSLRDHEVQNAQNMRAIA